MALLTTKGKLKKVQRAFSDPTGSAYVSFPDFVLLPRKLHPFS